MKQILRDLLHIFGLDIMQRPKYKGKAIFNIDGYSYGFVIPNANYTPWHGDAEFGKIYTRIKKNTLVDIYRCFELWQLTEQVYKLDNTAAILEVGVWRGGTAAVMSQKLKNLGARVPLYMADTFTGVVKSTDKDHFYTDSEHKDTSEALVAELMNDAVRYEHAVILKGIFPDDTQHLVPAGQRFSLCHIDVDVYASARDIVDWIWDKMIVGGIIVFDDYGFHSCIGITQYIEEQRHLTDRLIIHNINGHAIIVKLK